MSCGASAFTSNSFNLLTSWSVCYESGPGSDRWHIDHITFDDLIWNVGRYDLSWETVNTGSIILRWRLWTSPVYNTWPTIRSNNCDILTTSPYKAPPHEHSSKDVYVISLGIVVPRLLKNMLYSLLINRIDKSERHDDNKIHPPGDLRPSMTLPRNKVRCYRKSRYQVTYTKAVSDAPCSSILTHPFEWQVSYILLIA